MVADLLGPQLAAQAAPMLPFEPRVAGFDNQDDALLVSAAFQQAVADVAEKLSAAVDVATLAPCPVADASTTCLETFARTFARKAYGRTITDEETQRFLEVAATGDSYATSVKLIVEVVLQSPHTLYAAELGADAPPSDAPVTLTPHEVASQLSLLLTGARPDDLLLAAADNGRLSSDADLTAQIDRLLATPRAAQQLQLFVKGWSNLGPVGEAPKDPVAFPAFTPEVQRAMQEELDAFIDEQVAAGQGTFQSLLTSTSTHIPAALLPIYGADLRQAGTAAQSLDPLHRRGLLSLPGFLTYQSADQHSGPITRGLLVRRQLFCQDIPPPPPVVLQQLAQNPINTDDTMRTTRQKYEQHKTQTFCAGCHDQFDAIGFGMEEMDGLGRFRTTEHGLPVDSSGHLSQTDVDGPFNGVVELTNKLAGSQALQTCFVRQFFRFAAARVPVDSEGCLVDAWTQSFQAAGAHFRDLLVQYVTDSSFPSRKEDR